MPSLPFSQIHSGKDTTVYQTKQIKEQTSAWKSG